MVIIQVVQPPPISIAPPLPPPLPPYQFPSWFIIKPIRSPSSVTTQAAIFNNPDADIILRSSDNVEFNVYKFALSQASPYFRNMFMLPQPATASTSTSEADATSVRPVIDLTEPAYILEIVLRLCCPAPLALPSTLDRALAVLEAGKKYEMEAVTGSAALLLGTETFIKKEPLRVYLLAYQYKLPELARRAAKYTLTSETLGPVCKEMNTASATALFRLVQYRQERVKRAQDTVKRRSWKCTKCSDSPRVEGFNEPAPKFIALHLPPMPEAPRADTSPPPAAWWAAYSQLVCLEAAGLVGVSSESALFNSDAVARCIELSRECEECRKRPVRQFIECLNEVP